ncbi:MAG: glutamate-5-semialdehyde dehydrogenase [Kiritimatiellae bacterium]|nr:glutamate-5-semialdehyde dehydrogenase [Kiritimatiellia bacterium]
MSLHDDMLVVGQNAVEASRKMAQLASRKKNAILMSMAEELELSRDKLAIANKRDMDEGRNAGLNSSLLDRLELTPSRIDSMIKGLQAVASLGDPIGTQISSWLRPNGLEIVKERVPIGVIGIIYESRPNVTADTTALCLKTANAVILRGGKEAFHSNMAIAEALQIGGEKKGMPKNAVQLIDTIDREAVKELVQLTGLVDLVIPRGGETLIKAVTEMAHVPVIKHYKGVCHTYIDKAADLDKAKAIIVNAKCQRPGVCNAMETLLIHKDLLDTFVPAIVDVLKAEKVEIRGDEMVKAKCPDVQSATEEDWYAEYLDLILSIKIVDGVQEAIDHINKYGSKHSDAIISADAKAQELFVRDVDSATVYINASTRFTDGGEFGMGAEIGISTDKLHARGPMGLDELTTYKYIIYGDGQIRI